MLFHSTPPHGSWQPQPRIRRPSDAFPDDPTADIDDLIDDDSWGIPDEETTPETPAVIH